MAHVEYRGGRWKVQVRVAGKNEWHDLAASIGREQQAIAKAVGAKVADRLRRGFDVPSEREETCREWYLRWFEWREGRGDKDIKKLRGRFERYVSEHIGALPMRDTRREDLKPIVGALDKLVASGALGWKTAVNVWSQVVSRAFADAANGKEAALCVLKENPADGIRPPDRGARVRKQYLYPDEVLALLSSEDVPVWRQRLYAIAIYTYMRAGELAALRWDDVDVERGIIHVHQSIDRVAGGEVDSTKTATARRVVIEPALRPLLEIMRDERSTGLVFDRLPPAHGHDGQAPTLRADLLAAGVKRTALHERAETRTRKRMTFHDLRATGISWAAIRGDDALKIMSRSGHSEYSTMLGYVREAEVLRDGFGEVFPDLPERLTGVRPKTAPKPQKRPQKPRQNGVPKGIRKPVELAASDRESPRNDANEVPPAPQTLSVRWGPEDVAAIARFAAEMAVGELARQHALIEAPPRLRVLTGGLSAQRLAWDAFDAFEAAYRNVAGWEAGS